MFLPVVSIAFAATLLCVGQVTSAYAVDATARTVQAQAQTLKRGTSEEALAMLSKAARLVEAEGVENVQRVFGDAHGPFHEKDLYVTVLSLSGRMIAHGQNPRLVGLELLDLKDIDGRPFIKQSLDIAKEHGKGFVEYRWSDPLTKSLMPKRMYFKRVGDYTVNVGIYNPTTNGAQ